MESYTLSLRYVDWEGQHWTVSRVGDKFLHTRKGDEAATPPVLSNEFRWGYGGCSSCDRKIPDNREWARVIPANFGLNAAPITVTRNQPQPVRRQLAVAGALGQDPETFSVRVNGGVNAISNGVTIWDLKIDSSGALTGLVSATCSATAASFSLTINNGPAPAGETRAATLVVKPIASEADNMLRATLPDGQVGTPYSSLLHLGSLTSSASCYGFNPTFTVSSGQLPFGLSFGEAAECTTTAIGRTCILGYGIVGVPTSGGAFTFTVKATYDNGDPANRDNGDSFTRTYRVYIASQPAPLPSGALHWWQGTGNGNDSLKRTAGRLNSPLGSAGYALGHVEQAFSFNGTFGSVQLPDNFFPFMPASDQPFTFETWFKTASGGVIFGRQDTDPWGLLPTNYAPGIYVGNDGRLRVQMFWNGGLLGPKNPVTSQALVNNDAFHHVAVIYDGTQQIVYLDGAEMGRATYTHTGTHVRYKYQLGTGYTLGWPAGASFGVWNGFNGLIDEPTLYRRALTPQEVQAIFTAGGAGKIEIAVGTTPPSCAGGNGIVEVRVTGNAPPYTYSFDGGATFQVTSYADGLSVGAYNVIVKDGYERTFTAAATVASPAPLNFSFTGANPTCPGASNGSLTITATGGAGARQYSINDGQSFQAANVFSNLAAGTYKVVVKDASGCSSTAQNVTLTNPAPVTAQVSSGGGAIRPGQTANVTVAVTGGTGPYTVTLSNNGGTRTGPSPLSFTLGPQATTNYAVTAGTDANGCPVTATGSATITVDGTPPTIACPPAPTAVSNNGAVAVNYPAPTVTDNLPGATVGCTPASGATFALGVTPVNCTARDAVGNTAACSFTVTVRQPRAASKDLIARVRQLAPATLTTAQANQLIGHLEMANTNLERGQTSQACTHLQNFVNQVSALVGGGQLTTAQGQSLTSYANQMRNAVGCAGSPFPT